MSAAFVASRKVRHIAAEGNGPTRWLPACGAPSTHRKEPYLRGWPMWADYPGKGNQSDAYDREWARAVRLPWCTHCLAALDAMAAMVTAYPDGGA